MRKLLQNLDLISTKIARWGLTILVSFLVVFVFMGVICRYVLNWTPFFLEELSRYLLIWTGGLGASLAINSGSFPNVEIFLNWFPAKVREEIEIMAKVLLISFLLFFFCAGIIMALRQQNQMAATLPISMMWPCLSIPIGISLILPHSFLNLFYLQKRDNRC